MSFVMELWAFMRVRKKFWLLPILIMMAVFGGLDRAEQGIGDRAVHLHPVLSAAWRCASSEFRPSTTTARRRSSMDGEIVAAAQEERFTRKKHDARFPANAVALLPRRGAGSSSSEVDHVVFYDKPFLKFERLLETYLAFAPRGFRSFRMALPVWLKEKLFQKRPAAAGARALGAGLRLGQAAAVLPSITRAMPPVGVLSLALRGGGGPDDGRGRRMGDDLGRHRPRQQPRDAEGDPFPAFARACSTRRSPTTPGSRSIPANTR